MGVERTSGSRKVSQKGVKSKPGVSQAKMKRRPDTWFVSLAGDVKWIKGPPFSNITGKIDDVRFPARGGVGTEEVPTNQTNSGALDGVPGGSTQMGIVGVAGVIPLGEKKLVHRTT